MKKNNTGAPDSKNMAVILNLHIRKRHIRPPTHHASRMEFRLENLSGQFVPDVNN